MADNLGHTAPFPVSAHRSLHGLALQSVGRNMRNHPAEPYAPENGREEPGEMSNRS